MISWREAVHEREHGEGKERGDDGTVEGEKKRGKIVASSLFLSAPLPLRACTLSTPSPSRPPARPPVNTVLYAGTL